MEIIVSHNNTDLDGLASMIAARKLYPEAELVYAGKLHKNVREFMALHRDTFAFKLAGDIPLEQVTRLIMVDTKNSARIGDVSSVINNPGLEIHVYDHHPRTSDDVKAAFEVVDQVGAATTLLVELIRERGIEVNSFEATVLALGIYEDTGSLTFGTTTSRDAEAVAYLLSQGARLSVVSEFIDRPLSEPQKSLLNKLLYSSDTFNLSGASILLAKARVEHYVDGLALIVHKIMDIINTDAAVVVAGMEDRVHVVARSFGGIVDVSKIAAAFNGGGHPSAASAVVRDGDVDVIAGIVKELLKENIRPEIAAEDIMTSPVKMISPDKSIDEAAKILLRYGHTGIPVVDNGALIGIISRRDIDKARHHGLGHAPVKGYMSRKVLTVNRNTTISEIQDIMIENNIGRLPVVDNKVVVGIVSRTDVLKELHGENYPGRNERAYLITHPITCIGDNVSELLSKLPANIRELLGKIGYLADTEGYSVFAVGGFVRDLILGVSNSDIDLVVEGNGPAFAEILAAFLNGRVRIHEKFSTAIVILKDGLRIDVASSRTEYYEYPAALPKIEQSSIKQDLYRRDFTINAIAIALNGQSAGTVIDYFGGRRDIDEGKVRVLYNLSFVEDPTRILRAVRFEQRYGFKIESQTMELLKSAVKNKMLAKLSGERVREELRHILDEVSPIASILRMDELDIWKYILPEAANVKANLATLSKIPKAAEFIKNYYTGEINIGMIYIGVLVKDAGCNIEQIDNRLRFTKEEKFILTDLLCHCPVAITELLEPGCIKPSVAAQVLRNITPEGFVYLLAECYDSLVQKRVENYLVGVGSRKLVVTGEDIKKLGFVPGPSFKQAMEAARDAKLDGIIHSREQELQFIKQFMQTLEEKERR